MLPPKIAPFELMASATQHDVPTWVTVLFGCLLAGLIACLALEEKLHAKKSIIAGSFAIICLFLGTATGVLTFRDVVVGSWPARPVQTMEIELIDEATGQPVERVTVSPDPASVDHFPNHPDADSASDQDSAHAPPTRPSNDPVRDVPNSSPSSDDTSPGSARPGTDLPGDHAAAASEPASDEPVLHFGGHEITMPAYIPGIDWSVIAIILGSSLFVDVTSRSGLFSWIAIRATKLSGGDPLRLLYFYGGLTVVFSAVLNNVTAMIIVGSLTVVSLEKLERKHQIMPFLLIEGLLTNVGGMLTLISSVPNIIVGTTANISFASFFIKSAPYVILASVATLWSAAWIFKIRALKTDVQKLHARELVEGFDENDGISSLTFFRLSVVMLTLFILLIAGASALPVISNLGMGFVAMSMAAIMLLMFRSEVDKFYRAVDWDLIGFFMALFVVIYVMEEAQVLHWIGSGLRSVLKDVAAATAHPLDSITLLLGSAAFSSVTDNIPLSAMLASILHKFGTPDTSGLWWSVIFGSNLGGNLTPIGSASTLVAVTIMHKHQIKMSFVRFVQLAAGFAVVQILLAVAYVVIVIPWIPDF